MKKTYIDMSKVKDYKNPFKDAEWIDVTLDEEDKVFQVIEEIKKKKNTNSTGR